MTTRNDQVTDYILALDRQDLTPQDFGLNTWEAAVRAIRRFLSEGTRLPQHQQIIDDFQQFQQQRQAVARTAREPTPAVIQTGKQYLLTDSGTRLVNVANRRPDLVGTFGLRDNDFMALLQMAENPGMSEEDLEVSNPRGAIIALRQKYLIEPV